MKGLGNLHNLVRQAQQMQQRLGELQEELEKEEVSASAGGGMVTVTMNGKQLVTSIKIDPEIVKPEDTEVLQDLILVAVNEAQKRVQEMVRERMGGLTGGLSIPGLT
ncbi:MAG: YbaB/EbfC family nucleoid-associated protein [bacterium]|jgi:DNA-binding YbaB/EbfC family protein